MKITTTTLCCLSAAKTNKIQSHIGRPAKFVLLFASFALIMCCYLSSLQVAEGHGLGKETADPHEYEGKTITVTTEIIPSSFDSSTEDKKIKIRAFDSRTNKNLENVNFLLSLSNNEKLLFRNFFFAPNGNMTLNIHTNTSKNEVKITGNKEPLLGGWTATDKNSVEITGPVFDSAGLYKLKTEIRTIDDAKNVLDDPISFETFVSVTETTYHEINDIEQKKDKKFRVKSYYDSISDFSYDPNEKLIKITMPFDWSDSNISHTQVVHMEVSFPKEVEKLIRSSYVGKVNGIKLSKPTLQVDDFSEEKRRLIHFVILQDQIRSLKNQKLSDSSNGFSNEMVFTLSPSKDIKFPVSVLSDDQQFQVDLTWSPKTIEPGEKVNFIFTIRDGSTLDPLRQSTYDFVLQKEAGSGKPDEIYRSSGTAKVGGTFESYTFSEEQTGQFTVKFENIRDTDAVAKFNITVVPEFSIYVLAVFGVGVVFVLVLYRRNWQPSHMYGKTS